ncbi:MAG: 3-dehydroquinate synthase [Clostridia bacterium]|nr:3-dehydroquinate synthase [Clostridia bacterium]
MEWITLKTFSTESKIYVGDDALASRLPVLTAGQKNFVVTDENVYALYSDFFKEYFQGAEICVIQAGEEYKNFQSLYRILEKMTGAGLHRTSKLFAVGGGVIGDIGGLAAALYMRGISCVQIPTTLLSQVDSSVGGKTAVDVSGVKNVVGAFYQPCEVLVAPTFLKTLPNRELKCGVGEIVKYAALSGKIFDLLEKGIGRLNDLEFLTSLIVACIEHKARVVERDEKEANERRSLNVGHTTGHALELARGWSHGESVLFGMLLETEAAIAAGVCEEAYGNRLVRIVREALRMTPITEADFSSVENDLKAAKSDKKNTGDGKIQMAVAKDKNEWTMWALPFAEYCDAIRNAAKKIVRE